jgi:hypothetical protein
MLFMPCQLEPIITSFTLATGHFTKYKSSPDMYNGIIFISIKCGFFCFFYKSHLYCTCVMHISGSFHYLYQLSFFCACHKLEPSFPKQSQIVIKIIMVYTITHLINSMVTQRLLPIGYSYGKRLHSSTEIKKISIFYQQQN